MTETIDEIEALLPWYAAGALSDEERAEVEAALAARPELRASLATIEEDRGETIALNEALGAPRPDVWSRILREVEAAPRKPAWSARLVAWLGLGEAPRAPRLAWGMLAAGAIILLQAGALVALLAPGAKSSFGTASYTLPTGADVLVAFAPDARLEDLTRFLKDNQATIVAGPKGGMYELRVGDRALEKPELDALLKAISASPVVKLALPGGK
jgi:hypothetical protein